MRKTIKKCLIIALTVLVAFFMFEHVLLVSVAQNGIKYLVGLNTHMNRIIVNPLRGKVTIRGLKVYNPEQFKVKVLMDVPLVVLDFKPRTLYKKGAFFNKINIHIKELNIVRNEDGIVNLEKIKALTPRQTSGKNKPFVCDKYILKVDKMKYVDQTKEEPDKVKEFTLDSNEVYKNISNADNLTNIIAYKVFFNGKVGNIGVNIQKIQKDLALLQETNNENSFNFVEAFNGHLDKTKEALKNGAKEVRESVSGTIEKVKEKVQTNGTQP